MIFNPSSLKITEKFLRILSALWARCPEKQLVVVSARITFLHFCKFVQDVQAYKFAYFSPVIASIVTSKIDELLRFTHGSSLSKSSDFLECKSISLSCYDILMYWLVKFIAFTRSCSEMGG